MVIRIYWASVTGNRKIVGEQNRLRNVIESFQISSEWIDITTDPLVKQKMREECGNPKAMPPQIFNNLRYLGDVSDMEEFVEEGKGREWFEIDDVGGNDSGVVSLVNGVDKDETIKGVQTNAVEARLQDSPTSSIENDPSAPPSKPKNDPPPSRKAVLAAAGAFESMLKEPSVKSNKPKVIFPQSRSVNRNPNDEKTPLDEERRLRILGLSSSANTTTNGPSSERSAR